MNRTSEYYRLRAHILEQRDPIANARIIKKLIRRARALEA